MTLRLRAFSVRCLLAGASLVALPAAAQPSASAPAITLEFNGCESLDQRELLKLLAIEFQTLNVSPAAQREHVQIACGPSEARVTLDAASSSNRVDLAATAPAAWPRLLALLVSELVIAARARVAPAKVLARPTPVATVEPPLAAPLAPRVRLFAGPALRRAVRPATWLVGPQLGAEFDVLRNLALAADVRLEFGHLDTELAAVRWTSARGGLAVLVGGHLRHWRLALGPGLCLGYLRLSPTLSVAQASAHRVTGAWGGPELVARIAYELSVRWYVAASADTGVVTWPVSGVASDGRRLVDSGGGWLSGAAALGVQF